MLRICCVPSKGTFACTQFAFTMMRKRLPLLFILVLFVFTGCSDSNNPLLEKLQTAITSGEAGPSGYKTISLEKLTDFEWDTLYYFQQLTSVNDIRNEIGFKWDGTQVPNLHHRLLFVKNGQVTSFMDYAYADFPLVVYGCNQDRWVYPRSRTEFASFKYCQGDTVTYTFIPVACIENLQELMGQKCPEKKETK